MTTTPTNPLARILSHLDLKSDTNASAWPYSVDDSIGIWYRKLGRFHCWEAKGQARRLFLKLKDEIKDHLEQHGECVSAPVIWHVYMIGKSKETAYPIVFFCSKEGNARRKVKREIDRSGILDGYPGFKTGDCTRPPHFDELKPLAIGKSSTPMAPEIPDPACDNPMGMSIGVMQSRIRDRPSLTTATVGAVYNLDDSLFFSTAAHAFIEHDSILDFEEDSDDSFEFSFEDNEEILDQGQDNTDGERTSISGQIYSGAHHSRDSSSRNRSHQRRHIFDHEDIVFSSMNGPNPGLDYCLVMMKPDDPRILRRTTTLEGPCNLHIIHPTKPTNAIARDAAVVAYTGSREAKSGKMTGTPSFMTMPGGKTTQELWSVQLHGTLSNGDCGSIIVNERTGELEGHIVAGSPASGTAYIIPAYQVLQDIRTRFASGVRLWNRFRRCQAKVTSSPINHEEAKAMSVKFQEILGEARREKLSRCRRKLSAPPAYQLSRPEPSNPYLARSYIHNIPIVPQPPKNPRVQTFFHSLSKIPLEWNNRTLLQDALLEIPLDRIRQAAKRELEACRNEPRGLSSTREGAWGLQDFVIKELLRWFHESFFKWKRNPTCSKCGRTTTLMGMTKPNDAEFVRHVKQVELYKCDTKLCDNFERFPRHTDTLMLLRTRTGRNGEWARCFSMVCQAVGSRVRFVWSEDNMWTEVYSTYQKRWIHVDACEGAWDQPTLYCEGWGKKLSCCIAFSVDGATDVTRRYVRKSQHASKERRATSAELLFITNEIRAKRRIYLSTEARSRLQKEDADEENELRKCVAMQMAYDICKLEAPSIASAPPYRTEDEEESSSLRNAGEREIPRAGL